MIKITSLQTIAGALLAFGLSAAPAEAQANRTFVSGKGTDRGACGFAAPCRSFAFALNQTNAKGEIDVLDPAGYGTVTITKAISLVNDGVGLAAIAAPSGTAITITAGGGDSVHLRGLTIDGFGSGSNGIQFNAGGNLEIENCVARDFTNAGISISPSTSSSFSVSNTIASNNPGTGIFVHPIGSATVSACSAESRRTIMVFRESMWMARRPRDRSI
ncbi:MAG: right-handed parallel beta-helix repeat-containing protein [Methylocella sp.]